MSIRMRQFVIAALKKNNMTLDDLKKEGFVKLKSNGFMDLNIDYLGKECGFDKYSIAHNTVQNFDVMADPDMQFYDVPRITPSGVKDSFSPSTYQNDFTGTFWWYQECAGKGKDKALVVTNQSRFNDGRSFANQWASNLRNQGFVSTNCFLKDDTKCNEKFKG